MGNPGIASDLHWFWTWCDGELAAPSNFMAMVNAIRLGRSPGANEASTEMDERRLDSARKARRIARRLARVSEEDRHVLLAAFGPNACELPVLGEAAPVAALTTAAQAAHRDSHTTRSLEDWLVRLVWRVSKGQGDQVAEDSSMARAIKAEADTLLRAALNAYEAPRRGARTEKRGRDG